MSEADPLSPPEFAEFFRHLQQGRLAFPRCEDCGRFHWYPMPRCPHCRSAAIRWQTVLGRGAVYTFTSVRHAFDKSRRDSLPYTVALVEFAEAPGIRLVTNIVAADTAELHVGDAVEPVFENAADGTPLVHFRKTVGTSGERS